MKAAAVSHGNLIVTISENPLVSQPNPFARGHTVVVPQTEINVTEQGKHVFYIPPGVTLQDIVHAINIVGATPGDVVAILEALKAAGAVNAKIIVI